MPRHDIPGAPPLQARPLPATTREVDPGIWLADMNNEHAHDLAELVKDESIPRSSVISSFPHGYREFLRLRGTKPWHTQKAIIARVVSPATTLTMFKAIGVIHTARPSDWGLEIFIEVVKKHRKKGVASGALMLFCEEYWRNRPRLGPRKNLVAEPSAGSSDTDRRLKWLLERNKIDEVHYLIALTEATELGKAANKALQNAGWRQWNDGKAFQTSLGETRTLYYMPRPGIEG